jgi:hypothetical protein
MGYRPRRDPFSWILTAIGLCFLIGFPLALVAPAIGWATFRAVVACVVLGMGMVLIATVAIAVQESWRKQLLKFSLADLVWTTLLAAFCCGVLTTKREDVRLLAMLAIPLVLLAWMSLPKRAEETRSDFLVRVIVNSIVVGISGAILGGFILAVGLAFEVAQRTAGPFPFPAGS